MVVAPLYDYTIVPFIRSLKNILRILDKAEEHAREKGEDVEEYIRLQIYHDMGDFGFQIQRISDTAKFVVVRVAGVDAESVTMPDEEKTWADYKDRLQRTVTVLENVKAKDFVDKEDIEVSLFGGKYILTGRSYAQNFAIPNFYFHVTTAYDLLRGKGVPIGKTDFIGTSR